MDHVALDRARADDRHLDHQIIEGPRLDAPAIWSSGRGLDLEGAERVGLANHRVSAWNLGRDGGQIEVDIGRDKGLVGRRLRARSFPAQQTEVAIGSDDCDACRGTESVETEISVGARRAAPNPTEG